MAGEFTATVIQVTQLRTERATAVDQALVVEYPLGVQIQTVIAEHATLLTVIQG
ncbi:hypothetical protein D3C84_1187230 [compost metagenome]